MTLPYSIAKKLLALLQGEKLPKSRLKHKSITTMLANGILAQQVQGRRKFLIYCPNAQTLHAYLNNHFGIEDLAQYVTALEKEDLSRAEAVQVASDTKIKSIRSFKGFLVNSYQPIPCHLHQKPFTIHPTEGTFTHVYDYEHFVPDTKTTIVGIENPANFRHIAQQKRLFEGLTPLFVSRYPQSKDLVRWLQSIPNPYLHFGDFDFAGINIYWNEYKKHLGDKASFFVPKNVDLEGLIATKGNRDLYQRQALQVDVECLEEEGVMRVVDLVNRYRRGLEQEVLLMGRSFY